MGGYELEDGMEINKDTINIKKLVQDIKEAEQARDKKIYWWGSDDKWKEYCKANNLGRSIDDWRRTKDGVLSL